jgi:hypothetical protein
MHTHTPSRRRAPMFWTMMPLTWSTSALACASRSPPAPALLLNCACTHAQPTAVRRALRGGGVSDSYPLNKDERTPTKSKPLHNRRRSRPRQMQLISTTQQGRTMRRCSTGENSRFSAYAMAVCACSCANDQQPRKSEQRPRSTTRIPWLCREQSLSGPARERQTGSADLRAGELPLFDKQNNNT